MDAKELLKEILGNNPGISDLEAIKLAVNQIGTEGLCDSDELANTIVDWCSVLNRGSCGCKYTGRTFSVLSGGEYIVVDLDTGYPLSTNAGDIKRFDIEEIQAFYGTRLSPGDRIDACDIGCWKKDETYRGPWKTWR